MDQQLIIADSVFSTKHHQIRKERFLGLMDKLISCALIEAVIALRISRAGNGRHTYLLSKV